MCGQNLLYFRQVYSFTFEISGLKGHLLSQGFFAITLQKVTWKTLTRGHGKRGHGKRGHGKRGHGKRGHRKRGRGKPRTNSILYLISYLNLRRTVRRLFSILLIFLIV